jgi:N-acetylmuramoyl-L-alanine amidase CwlA
MVTTLKDVVAHGNFSIWGCQEGPDFGYIEKKNQNQKSNIGVAVCLRPWYILFYQITRRWRKFSYEGMEKKNHHIDLLLLL